MEDVKSGKDLTAVYATDLLPLASSPLPAQVYTFEIKTSITDYSMTTTNMVTTTFTWTLSDPCLAAAQTLSAPATQNSYMDNYSGTA